MQAFRKGLLDSTCDAKIWISYRCKLNIRVALLCARIYIVCVVYLIKVAETEIGAMLVV